MRRSWLILILVAACGGDATSTTTEAEAVVATTSTTSPPTTTAPTTTTLSPEAVAEAELESAIGLIATLYRDYSDSWFQGLEGVYQFLTDHNHPSIGCTVDDFRTYWALIEGTTIETVVHQDTVQRHDGWIVPATGEVPEGVIYVYQITETWQEPGFEPSPALEEVHTAIIDGVPYFFYGCRDLV